MTLKRKSEGTNVAMKDDRPMPPATAQVSLPATQEDKRPCLQSYGGSISNEWNNHLINQTVQTAVLPKMTEADRGKQISAAFAALRGISPKDELEGMLAAQMVASHNAAMEGFRRAMFAEQTFEGRAMNLGQANKASRTYAALLEALSRYRGTSGQQKVTVEHVHVHKGGQAIVGNVDGAGGRGRRKKREEPHAITYSPAEPSPVWSEDTQRDAVPVPRNAERTMSDARRPEPRGAKR